MPSSRAGIKKPVYLLDTHVLIWAVGAPERLSDRVRKIVSSGQIKVSAASLWEMILKKNKKDAPTPDPVAWWDRHVTRAFVETLPIRVQHVAQLDRLPDVHHDPFDRILMAQAACEDLPIITADQAIAQYALVKTVWL
jgi:PIN domain nuclease of toxin-antitoxin system